MLVEERSQPLFKALDLGDLLLNWSATPKLPVTYRTVQITLDVLLIC